MTKTKVCLIIIATVWFCACEAEATYVTLDDGEIHDIDWITNNIYRVRNSSSGAFTTVNILLSGRIVGMGAYDDSRINFLGGACEMNFDAYDRSLVNVSAGNLEANLYARNWSQVSISGGLIQDELWSREHSQVNISGGETGGYLRAQDNSHVIISGGIFGGKLCAYQNSVITIYGSNFNYPYGILSGSGTLTGILDSGEAINNQFWNDSYGSPTIMLVPEPTTLLLLGLGSLVLLKNHKK